FLSRLTSAKNQASADDVPFCRALQFDKVSRFREDAPDRALTNRSPPGRQPMALAASEPSSDPRPAEVKPAARLIGDLDRFAQRTPLVLALMLLVNAVVLPYRGLYHDARLYAAQIAE